MASGATMFVRPSTSIERLQYVIAEMQAVKAAALDFQCNDNWQWKGGFFQQSNGSSAPREPVTCGLGPRQEEAAGHEPDATLGGYAHTGAVEHGAINVGNNLPQESESTTAVRHCCTGMRAALRLRDVCAKELLEHMAVGKHEVACATNEICVGVRV